MTLRNFGIWGVAGAWAIAALVAPAGAQENLDHGKTAAQLFASDCAICHKSPNGLGKGAGLFGVDSFLRVHYTASKESATALAKYLAAFADAPVPGSKKTKRSTKGSDKDKKPVEAKSAKDKSSKEKDSKPAEAKAEPKDEPKKEMKVTPKEESKSEAKPETKSEAKPEPKAEAKPEPKVESKPEAKPEKSD